MGRFGFDPNTVTAGFEILPKGDYILTVMNPKGFAKNNDDGTLRNHGVRVTLKVAQTDNTALVGKTIQHTLYGHTEGSNRMTKQFVMAAYGFGSKDEKAFNEAYGAKDWTYDENSVGEVYSGMDGKVIFSSLSVKLDDNGNEQQDYKSIKPYTP